MSVHSRRRTKSSDAGIGAASNPNSAPSPKLGEQIAATPAKLEKIRLLADYLRSLDAEQLRDRRHFLTGKPFAQNDQRTLQTGWAIIYRALLEASGREQRRAAPDRGQPRRREQDRIRSARRPNHARTILVRRSAARFSRRCTKPAGRSRKTELLAGAAAKTLAARRAVLVKILTGDLRIGLREGLVEEAIARAFEVPLDELKEAHMLLGDIGADRAARRPRGTRARRADSFSPDQMHAGQPGADRGSDLGAFRRGSQPNEPMVYVEDKFDGIRAQMHRGADACGNFLARPAADHGPIRRDRRAGARLR